MLIQDSLKLFQVRTLHWREQTSLTIRTPRSLIIQTCSMNQFHSRCWEHTRPNPNWLWQSVINQQCATTWLVTSHTFCQKEKSQRSLSQNRPKSWWSQVQTCHLWFRTSAASNSLLHTAQSMNPLYLTPMLNALWTKNQHAETTNQSWHPIWDSFQTEIQYQPKQFLAQFHQPSQTLDSTFWEETMWPFLANTCLTIWIPALFPSSFQIPSRQNVLPNPQPLQLWFALLEPSTQVWVLANLSQWLLWSMDKLWATLWH